MGEVSEKMEDIGPIYRVLETTLRLDGYEDEALAGPSGRSKTFCWSGYI